MSTTSNARRGMHSLGAVHMMGMKTHAPKAAMLLPAAAILAVLASTSTFTGSMASWSDSTAASSTTISSGSLDLQTAGATWTLDGAPFDPSTDRLGSGDQLVGTVPITSVLEGSNLKAKLEAEVSKTGSGATVSVEVPDAADLTPGTSQSTAVITINWTAAASYSHASEVTASVDAVLSQIRGGSATAWTDEERIASVTVRGAEVDISIDGVRASSQSHVLAAFQTGATQATALDANGSYFQVVPVKAHATIGTDVEWAASLPSYQPGTVFGDADVSLFTVASSSSCNEAGIPSGAGTSVSSSADDALLCFAAIKGAPEESPSEGGAIVTGESSGEPVADETGYEVTVLTSADPSLEPATQGSFTHQLTGKK